MKNESSREFNDAGLCVPHLHYMADRSAKVKDLAKLVEKGKYFTINLPRQYGKTTLLYLLEKELGKLDYLVIPISFEGIGDTIFSGEDRFAPAFLKMLLRVLVQPGGNNTDEPLSRELSQFIPDRIDKTTSLHELSDVISEMAVTTGKKIILQIDEVDKFCNNQLFLSFLGMLRAKYLLRNKGKDSTFHSVILAGVHDVKNLKIRISPDEEEKYNSPWNIAVDLDLDLSLSSDEIASMLEQYTREKNVSIDIPGFSRDLYYLTSGYPFLVSFLCKIIDEKILPGRKESIWEPGDLDHALQVTLKKDNTNFQSLIKNLENNPELYEFVFDIIMNEQEFFYNPHNAIIQFGLMYGVLREEKGKVKVHNRLYEQLIYNYMASRLETSGSLRLRPVGGDFTAKDGALDIQRVMLKFQEFMKEQYSEKDQGFLERNGRLIFLAFLKPIINGSGFDFKEAEISEEKRLDVVITFFNRKYIIELKKWYGEESHQRGLKQLAGYLERQNLKNGYLIIFDSRRLSNKIGQNQTVTIDNRDIFITWV